MEFAESLDEAKHFADSKVVQSAYQRAIGFDIEEITKERRLVGKDNNGNPRYDLVVTKVVTEHVYPMPSCGLDPGMIVPNNVLIDYGYPHEMTDHTHPGTHEGHLSRDRTAVNRVARPAH